jgi:hypothetical protein
MLFGAACSGGSNPEGERSLLAETPGATDGGEKRGKGGNKAGKGSKKEDKAADPGAAPGGSTTGGSSGVIEGDVDVPGASEEQEYPTASAELTEPNPDAQSQGITPGYAEMTGARIEGLGKKFRVTLSFGGQIPEQMPNDKTIMVIGFQLIRGDDEGYAFAGQATHEGWKPYAGGKDKRTKFPGTFEVQANEIVMTIPWKYPSGAFPFKWMATSNWFQSLANTTHYKFDLIPNKDQANYPG